jgi:murein DD-endopeptidase MepM/ murein hydrolase activator NlpD
MKGAIMRRTTVLLLLIVFTVLLYAQQPENERFVQVINRLVEAMNNQDYAGIVREYDKGMTVAFPLFKTTYFFKNNFDTFGKVLKVDPPQVRAIDQAVCVMYFERGIQDLTLYIDNQGKIKGFLFTTHVAAEPQPAEEPKPTPTQTTKPPVAAEATPVTAQKPVQTATQPVVTATFPATTQKPTQTTTQPVITEPAPATTQKPTQVTVTPTQTPAQPVVPVVKDKQQTELYPPFKGKCIVAAGGELREGNAQRNLLQQQYAYDFSGVDANGLHYKNDGKTNEEYVGYGMEVLSPANGTVVEAIDGIRENSPGMRNPYALIGNAVIIQHTNREYSVLAFLKQGSIHVKVGDKVTRGQVIAQCGSSGSATEPVLHYHLQDSPYLQTAKSIKFYFERAIVTKEGKKELKLLHLPEIGDVINLE